jgi:general stress protein YciG
MATRKKSRGFAAMDPERQRAIASKGGRAAHESGKAHEWSSEEARAAGRAAHESGKAHEWNTAEARKAGHLGGIASHSATSAQSEDSVEQSQDEVAQGSVDTGPLEQQNEMPSAKPATPATPGAADARWDERDPESEGSSPAI